MMCLIYFYKGATRNTKKSIDHKAIIRKRGAFLGYESGELLDDLSAFAACFVTHL